MNQKLKKILIIGNIYPHPSSEAFLEKFVKIIKELSNTVYVICGDQPPIFDNINWVPSYSRNSENILNRIYIYLINQLLQTCFIIQNRNNYDMGIVLGPAFLIQTFFLKLIDKKVALFVDGKTQSIFLIFAKINFILADVLLVESENVMNVWNIQKYKDKIIYSSIYVDSYFSINKHYDDRELIIGYIGSLEKGKGVQNFVESIPLIQNEIKNSNFMIIGNGELFSEIEEYILDNNLKNTVKLLGWIPHDEIPNYLNELKLFIMPSYSEGLPNSVLEAMSCGVPVLSTPVGGIPDIIKEGKTGFIMEKNSKELIAENVIKIISKENNNEIIKNAKELISNEYSYDASVKRFEKIFID